MKLIIIILFILFILVIVGCSSSNVERMSQPTSLDSVNSALINLTTQYNNLSSTNDKCQKDVKTLQDKIATLDLKITKNTSDINTINTILDTLGKAVVNPT
jgi:peptidoglycan hydrolase CwlO-like protein